MVREYDPDKIPSVYNLADAPIAKDGPGFEQVVFRGVDQMVGMTTIGPEREDKPQHSHPWEQITIVIQGEVDFLVDGERISLTTHDAVEIPPDVPHASRAVAEEQARLLAFWPLREDRLEATEYQKEFHV